MYGKFLTDSKPIQSSDFVKRQMDSLLIKFSAEASEQQLPWGSVEIRQCSSLVQQQQRYRHNMLLMTSVMPSLACPGPWMLGASGTDRRNMSHDRGYTAALRLSPYLFCAGREETSCQGTCEDQVTADQFSG